MHRIIFASITCVPVLYYTHCHKEYKIQKSLSQNVFSDFSTSLSETFRIVRRSEGDVINEHKVFMTKTVIHVRS
jgi:hypothetical protein